MSFNIDIIECIGSKCDNVTKFMLASASKEYYSSCVNTFTSFELIHISEKIKTLLRLQEKERFKNESLQRCHDIFTFIVNTPHIKKIKQMKPFIETAISKLDDLANEGIMNKNDAMYYKEQLIT